MHKHGCACSAHGFRNGFRRGARLAEKQAFASPGHLCSSDCNLRLTRFVRDQELSSRWLLRWIDHDAFPLGRSTQPFENSLWISHRCAQPGSLNVVTGNLTETLDHAHQVGAAVGAGDGTHFVNHDHSQVVEQRSFVNARRNQHHFQRFGRRHQQLGGLRQKLLAGAGRRVSVPHKAVQAHHLRVQAQSLLSKTADVVDDGKRLGEQDFGAADALRLGPGPRGEKSRQPSCCRPSRSASAGQHAGPHGIILIPVEPGTRFRVVTRFFGNRQTEASAINLADGFASRDRNGLVLVILRHRSSPRGDKESDRS